LLYHPDKRSSCKLNRKTGWYVDPVLNYYHYLEYYFPYTREIRACYAEEFFPHQIEFLIFKVRDFLMQAASNIIYILTQKYTTTTPSLEARDSI